MRLSLVCLAALLSGATLMPTDAQVLPLRPKLENPESFSMILLPDPQSYIKFDANQPIFELMSAWCVNNADSLRS